MEWEQVRDPPVLGFSDPAAAEVACGFVVVCIACCSFCPCTGKKYFLIYFITKTYNKSYFLIKKLYLSNYKFKEVSFIRKYNRLMFKLYKNLFLGPLGIFLYFLDVRNVVF